MKKITGYKFLWIVSVIIIAGGTTAQAQEHWADTSGKSILQKCRDRLKEFAGFEYDAGYKIKYFDNIDTTNLHSRHCLVLKKQQDTILKYHALVSDGHTDMGYTGDQFFKINKKENWLQRESAVVLGRSFIRNNIGVNFVPGFFYADDPFNTWIKAATSITRLDDYVSKGKKIHVIKFTMKPDEEITRSERYLFIDRQTWLPVKVEIFAEYKGIQQEYQELILRNIKGIKNKEAAIQYTFPQGIEPGYFNVSGIKKEITLLTEGSPAPMFAGTDINNKEVRQEDWSDRKLVLLDFWYLACAPCLEAIPALADLQKEYSAKGLQVLGLNSTDTAASRIAEIKKFIPVLNMNYPVILIGKETEQAYKVTVWPTIYLIENEKIIYATSGYDKAELKKIRTLIEERLMNGK